MKRMHFERYLSITKLFPFPELCEISQYLGVAVLIMFTSCAVFAQNVSISSDGSDPNANAILDVKNPSSGDGKGLLIPQLTEAQRTTADSTLGGGLLDDDGNLRSGVAAQGLIVYQTDGTQGFYYNTSTTTTPSWYYLVKGNSAGAISSFDSGSSTAVGYQALAANTTGSSNTAIGQGALYANTTASENTATGQSAMYSNTTGYQNTATGTRAMYSNTTGNQNTATGQYSLYSNTTGSKNTASGQYAMYSNTTGSYNTATGQYALLSNSVGKCNTATGQYSLLSNTTGNYNTAVGTSSLSQNTTASGITAIGYSSMYGNTTGSSSTAVGYQTLYSNTTGVSSTAVGYQALYSNTTASENTAVGYSTLYANTTGVMNTAMGNAALTANTTGNYNTGIGYAALTANTTGDASTAVGIHALGASTTGKSNVGMGFFSLSNTTTGSYNAAYGYASGNINVTGSKNTFIGHEADASSSSDLTNATALGYQAKVDASNKVVIGNSSVTAIGGYADWSNYSDRREKKEITDCKIGLEFVEKLRPVNFKYKNQDKLRNGFIAQEVEEICNKTGVEFGGLTKPAGKNGRYMLSYGEFVVPLVNAAKELKAKNEALETEVSELRTDLNAIKKRLGIQSSQTTK